MDRLFLAVLPANAAAASEIAETTRQVRMAHGLKARPIAPTHLHVSLHAFGDYAGLHAAMVANAARRMPPFKVAFDRVTNFRGRPHNLPIVLRGDDEAIGLFARHQAIGMTMRQAGLKWQARRNYTPHVTLLYGDHAITEQAVATIEWTVREIVLVHSLFGRHRHIHLARWPLRG